MFEEQTMERIKAELMEAVVSSGVGLSTEEGGFLDHLLGPVAFELWKLYRSMDALLPVAFVDESSGGYIDLRCAEYGITRKAGRRARAAMKLRGKAGTSVPAGTVFLTAEGLEFRLLDGVPLTGGEDTGTIEAAEEGDEYNVEAGTAMQMVVTVPGLEHWHNAAAAGGANRETDAALVGRLYDFLQRPATSGNVYHYEQWAKEVDGIGAARVTPLWNGPGTVKVLVAGPEYQPVSASVVSACTAHIEERRPIGAAVTVKSAQGLAVDVAATVTLESSVTAETVAAELRRRLDEYLKSIAFVSYTMLYNRVAYLLLGIEGVRDYCGLTLNGGTVNLEVGTEQVPAMGEVAVTCV